MPIRLFVADGAAVQHHVVADDAIRADLEGKAGIGMQHRVVLDLRALAELDPLVVAAQHRVEPDAGVGLEPHAPDHDRAVGDPIAPVGRQVRRLAIKLEIAIAAPPRGRRDLATAHIDWRGGFGARQRAQPTGTPNARNPITTMAPDIMLQQPAMAQPIASAKTCSTCSAVMTPPQYSHV